MKTLKSYINEGFYKNVNADVTPLIVEFVESCILTVTGGSLIGKDIRSALYMNSSDEIVLDIDKLRGLVGKALLCIRINNENKHLINACNLFTSRGLCVNAYLVGVDNDELRTFKHAFPFVSNEIRLNNCSVDNLEDLPRPVSPHQRTVRLIMTKIKDLRGCPDCDTLVLAQNNYIKSLSGSRISRLTSMNITKCPYLTTLQGSPKMAKDTSSITLDDNKSLNFKYLTGILPSGCKIKRLYLDGSAIMDSKCNFDGIEVYDMSVVFRDMQANASINPEIVDCLPTNITSLISIYTYGVKASNKDEILELLGRRYPRVESYVRSV